MKITEYIKEHPWTIAAGVGGLFVLYLLYSSSSSSATATGVSTVDPNVLAAETQLQLSQNAIAGQSQQLQYQLAGQQNQASADVAIATLQQQGGEYNTTLGAQVSLAGIGAQQDVQIAGINSQTQIAQGAQETNQAQIAATQALGIANADVYSHIADVQGATTIASYQANVAQTQIGSNTTLGVAQLQSNTPNYGASESNLISAIQSTGQTGSGLLPQVQAAAAGGANAGVWATITGLVNQWASRTTSANNQAGKSTILGALNPVTY